MKPKTGNRSESVVREIKRKTHDQPWTACRTCYVLSMKSFGTNKTPTLRLKGFYRPCLSDRRKSEAIYLPCTPTLWSFQAGTRRRATD